MKVFSNYFNKEIELPSFDVQQGEKTISVVSYNALKHLIYSDQMCIKNGVQAHYTPVVIENGHYGFICTISDDPGRRVEGFGESLPATLDTKIAQDYPSFMAAKRAFSDAALLFLGLPDAYSDVQIPDPRDAVPENAAEYAHRKKAAEAKAKKESKASVKEEKRASAEIHTAKHATPPVKAVEDAAEPAEEITDLFESIDAVLEELPWEDNSTADDPANLTIGEPESVAMSANKANGHTDEAASSPKKGAPAPVEPPAPAEKKTSTRNASQGTSSAAPIAGKAPQSFDFANELINIGSFKANPIPVAEAYKVNPGSIEWIADKMHSSNAERIHQQEVCKAYLRSIGK